MLLKARGKKPSGILNVKSRHDKVTLALHSPSQDLEIFVEHYWIVKWDLRGKEPYVSENLPHPSVHLIIEQGQSRIIGVVKQKFSIMLQEKGFVFGIKFWPGAFYPFVNIPIYKYTGLSVPLQDIFGEEAIALENAILLLDDERDMIKLAESFIRMRLPEHDEMVLLVKKIVDNIIADRRIAKVEDIANRFHMTTRMVQRLFSKYVGVSPKWVIQRYRLLEVADQLAVDQHQSWPELAIELGYYDQSHFIKDFKSIVGVSPEEYVRKNRRVDVH
jgi:AraC-like DNA-binding protein